MDVNSYVCGICALCLKLINIIFNKPHNDEG